MIDKRIEKLSSVSSTSTTKTIDWYYERLINRIKLIPFNRKMNILKRYSFPIMTLPILYINRNGLNA